MLPSGNVTMVTILVLETFFGMIIDEFLVYLFSNNFDEECQDAKFQKKLVLDITFLSFCIPIFFFYCNNDMITVLAPLSAADRSL